MQFADCHSLATSNDETAASAIKYYTLLYHALDQHSNKSNNTVASEISSHQSRSTSQLNLAPAADIRDGNNLRLSSEADAVISPSTGEAISGVKSETNCGSNVRHLPLYVRDTYRPRTGRRLRAQQQRQQQQQQQQQQQTSHSEVESNQAAVWLFRL
jgi:hypothetical protein